MCLIWLIFYIWSQDRTRLIEKEMQKVYNLPITYTMEQAINDALVDVTSVSDKPNEMINDFLFKVEHKGWVILKTIEETGDDLVITVYFFDDRIDEIRTWEYFIKAQSSQSPDRRFKSAYTITNNGVSTVYLVNIWNTQRPNYQSEILKDEVLYSYAESN